jgi:hypothetical protein
LINGDGTCGSGAEFQILAVSGYGDRADAADAALAKPYQPDQVLAAANALLAGRGGGFSEPAAG